MYSISSTVSHTASSSKDSLTLNSCGLGIGITAVLCCLVIGPLSGAVGAVSVCIIVRRQVRRKRRPLPEPPRPTEEAPGTHNLVYDYVSDAKIGTLRNQAYGQHHRTFQKIEEGEELEKEEKEEKLEAEEHVQPAPTTPV